MHASRRRQHLAAVLTEPVTVVARPPSSNSFAMNQAVGLRGIGGLALVRPQTGHHSLAPLLHALAAMHPLHHCQSSHPSGRSSPHSQNFGCDRVDDLHPDVHKARAVICNQERGGEPNGQHGELKTKRHVGPPHNSG